MAKCNLIYRGTRPDEAGAILDLWASVFENANRDVLRSFLETDPWREGRYGRVCEEDGRLVSIVYIARRPVMTRRGVRIMGGIGYVGTRPDCRGRGINTELMWDCLQLMEQERFDFSVLLTPINPYYERLGYHTVIRPVPVITPGWDGWHGRMETAELAEAAPPIPELLRVYLAFNENRPISVVRDEACWKGWSEVRLSESRWMAVRRGGDLVAFAAYRMETSQIVVAEAGWLPECPELAGELARALIALAAETRRPMIHLNLPLEPAFQDAARATGAFVHLDHRHDTMFRRLCMDPVEYEAMCKEITEGTGVFWPGDTV